MALLTTEGVATDRSSLPSSPTKTARRLFPVVVFTLTFALLLSDYMSRQVLSAVFPLLKSDWHLSDTQLGSLTSIVALTVGVLAVPLSLLGDRWGRTRAIVAMGAVWSLATLGSAIAANYEQMLLARTLIGVGEAAYGSVGLAVVLAVFPIHRRASLTGSFMAGGVFGTVLGVMVGGAVAGHLGWRWAFAVMAIFGLVLVALYRILISDKKLARYRYTDATATKAAPAAVLSRAKLRTLISTPAVVAAYIGSGLQLCVAGALFAWLPSYINRTYHLPTAKSATYAGVFFLIMGAGMIYCGAFSDRLARRTPIRKWTSALVYAACSLVFLGLGFSTHHGFTQIMLLAVGAFFAAGTAGPAGAMVANLTDESIRATAMGTLTLANNVLGLAAGPFLVGVLADQFGLATAMKIIPLASVGVIVALIIGRATYHSSLRKVNPAGLDPTIDDTDVTSGRRSVVMPAITGALLQGIAVLLVLVIAPKATVLAENADVTARLSGTVTMLNSQAIKNHDLSHVFIRNAPLTAERRVHVTSTHGNTAIVAVDQTLHVGKAAMPSTHVYAVDRTTRESAPAPAGVSVEPADGLTIGYPVGPKPANGYTSYDPTTQVNAPVTYQGKATRGGRDVYVYTTDVTGAVKDKGMLASLPPALPKPVLTALASRLPANVQTKVLPALQSLPAVVPLHYVSASKTTAYVDSVTGGAVDQSLSQQIVATIQVNGTTVPLLPVLALDVKVTPASVHALAARSEKAANMLDLVGRKFPIGLVIAGLGFEVVALLRRRKNRKLAVVDAASAPSPEAAGIR